MPSDTDDDILASRWRDGLRTLAQPGDPTTVADRVRVRVRARRRRRLIAAGAAAVIAIAGITGLALTFSRSTPSTPNLRAGAPRVSGPAPDRFQIRPVLAIGTPPCRPDQLPGRGQNSLTCYSLGPVTLDGYDVSSVVVSTRTEDGTGVDLVVGGEAFGQLNAVAARQYGQPQPLNEIALVVDGRVVSAPRLNDRVFRNNTLRFAGLADADAQRIAALVGPRSRLPGASTGRMRATLALWSAFPMGTPPRPLVVGSDVVDPPGGFPDNAAKEAYLAGSFVPPRSYPSAPASADGYALIAARDAFVVLKAAGRPPAAPTALTVSTVKLATATFTTDRGPRTLPAWLFSLVGVREPAAVLAVTPGARFNPVGLDQFSPSGGSNISLIVGRGTAALGTDGSTLTITFGGDAPGTGPCTATYNARVLESATAVAITIAETPKPPDTAMCAGVGHQRELTVTLQTRLGDRVLIDGTTGQAIPVSP